MTASRSLVVLALTLATVQAQEPWNIPFSGSAGPDGPWNVIPLAVSYPEQVISVYPGLTGQNMWVYEQACPPNGNLCPLPVPGLWNQNGNTGTSQNAFNDLDSPNASPTAWNSDYADLMNLTGAGHLSLVRVVLQPSSTQNSSRKYYLDGVGSFMSLNASSSFPGGSAFPYTPDVGLLDLVSPRGPLPNTTSWKNVTGSTVNANSTLGTAYSQGAIPSVSFGLHIGSAVTNASIPGSLYLGGYDSARVLSTPVVSNFPPSTSPVTVRLVDIELGIVNGSSPFANVPSGSIPGLLQGSANGSTSVSPDPGIPYLYLSRATCDAIARNLPVTYSPDLNLYLWNTSSPSYSPLIASNTYLSFVFNQGTSTGNVTINVPLILLSLALDSPVVSFRTPYFPCRPYDDPASKSTVVGSPNHQASATTDSRQDGSKYAGFRLGRAFLQAAFLGINWQANTLWLAQAPGPQLPQSAAPPVTMATKDQSLDPLAQAPSWAETWSATLGEFDGPPYTPQDVNDSTLPGYYATDSEGGLSSRVIGGIIVGVVLGLLLLGSLITWLVVRRKRRAKQAASAERGAERGAGPAANGEKLEYYGYSADYKLAPTADETGHELAGSSARFESGGQERPAELIAGSGQVHEMPATAFQPYRRSPSPGVEEEEAEHEEATSPMLGAGQGEHGHDQRAA